MTKEKLYDELANVETEYGLSPIDVHNILEDLFSQNVVIPKGENRHPYADVLHEWVEGMEIEFINPIDKQWAILPIDAFRQTLAEVRIKPKEPVYEALVRINYSDGTYDDTERYFTHEEFEQFGFPKSCEWAIETKRERK